jgi:hypothetical protein
MRVALQGIGRGRDRHMTTQYLAELRQDIAFTWRQLLNAGLRPSRSSAGARHQRRRPSSARSTPSFSPFRCAIRRGWSGRRKSGRVRGDVGQQLRRRERRHRTGTASPHSITPTTTVRQSRAGRMSARITAGHPDVMGAARYWAHPASRVDQAATVSSCSAIACGRDVSAPAHPPSAASSA